MEALLDSIRIAVSDGASDDERRRGLLASRAVADALEGGLVADVAAPSLEPAAFVEPRRLVAPSDAAALAAPATVASRLADPLVSNPFADMTADQILDLAIAKLRGAVGEDTAPQPVGQPFRLTLVPLPRRFP